MHHEAVKFIPNNVPKTAVGRSETNTFVFIGVTSIETINLTSRE